MTTTIIIIFIIIGLFIYLYSHLNVNNFNPVPRGHNGLNPFDWLSQMFFLLLLYCQMVRNIAGKTLLLSSINSFAELQDRLPLSQTGITLSRTDLTHLTSGI